MPTTSHTTLRLLRLGLFLLLSGAGFPACAQPASFVTDRVSVGGLVEHPFIITTGNMGNFPLRQIKDPVGVLCTSGEVRKNLRSFTGVLLRDILDSAGVRMPHNKAHGEYIVHITASDGYKVIFAWNELYYGPAGEKTWLIFTENGSPVAEEGRFVILCASDLVTGPRHVKWVKKIEVRRIE